MRVIRFLMRETMFDESYNIREVLDDVIERVTLREKLIQTAKGFAEKKKEERYTLAIRQFENLMTDFLRLYQPILDRLRSYRDGLQKELSGCWKSRKESKAWPLGCNDWKVMARNLTRQSRRRAR